MNEWKHQSGLRDRIRFGADGTARSLKGVAPWLAALAFISPGASAGSSYPFVPEAFNVPPVLEADTFRLRMLTVNDVIKDYDAVMSSAAHIRSVWPDSGWPSGLTLEQNLIDLGWHQREFQREIFNVDLRSLSRPDIAPGR